LRSSTDLTLFRYHYEEPTPPGFRVDDGCLDFKRGAAEFPETGFADRAAWERAQVPRDLLNFSWRGSHEIKLPEFRDGRLEVSPTRIRVLDGAHESHLKTEGGTRFIAVQPFLAGSRLCVAAATSDGLLTWSDSTDIPMAPALRVDLGAPVQSMGLINEATLRVVCADGRVVLLNPPLVAGETLRGIAAVTDAPPAPPGIILEENTVRIGGVAIPRRTD